MMFQKRVDRAMERLSASRRQREAGNAASRPGPAEYDPKAQREEPELSEIMEKGDMPAMLLSAFLVILPVCLIALLVMAGAGILLFRG